MSDRPPETDKAERMAYANEYMVPTEVACRLECERDEARQAFVIATDEMVKAQCRTREALRERDDAREKAERYRLEANAMMLQRDEAREALRIIADLENWFHTTKEEGGPYTAWRGNGEPDEIAMNVLEAAK